MPDKSADHVNLIDSALAALVLLDRDAVRSGPRRSGDPDALFACDKLIAMYPALARDPGFLYCLYHYDEIGVTRRECGLFFSVHGFTYYWYDQVENGYELVDPYGFVPIGTLDEKAGRISVFALPAYPEQDAGIYVGAFGPDDNLAEFQYSKCGDGFADWLDNTCRGIRLRVSRASGCDDS